MRAALLFLGFILAAVILAPVLAPVDPLRTDPENGYQPPSSAHVLGTDNLGRDVFSRLVYGGRRTLAVAACATLIAAIPGLAVGLLAGIDGSRLERIIQLVVDALLAFPGLLLALIVLTVIGQGAFSLALAVGLSQIAPFIRVVRSTVLSIRSIGYIEASEALGGSRMHIALHHILPNITTGVLAYTAVVFSYSIINGAALSFLGLGGEPGVPDWGVMLADGRFAFRSAPWVALYPGLAITITVILVNHISDSIPRHTWR